MQLPAELRNRIYHIFFVGSTVSQRFTGTGRGRRRALFGPEYRGAFSLIYVCRQIHREASSLPTKLVTFDFTRFTYINRAIKILDSERAKVVRAIRMSAKEANAITEWMVKGTTEIERRFHSLRVLSSLVCIEVDSKEELVFDLKTVKSALRCYAGREEIEIYRC